MNITAHVHCNIPTFGNGMYKMCNNMIFMTQTFFEHYCEYNDFNLDTLPFVIQNGDIFHLPSKISNLDK